ncbi:MAG: glycoside hydrolase family 2 protein [Bacilli bacterium]|nr:glycoside hydrolase family 2 protein [Bacilli bacterium]
MKKTLSYNWNFVPGFKAEYLDRMPSNSVSVDIPHNVINTPAKYFSESDYQGIFTYEKIFDCPRLKNRKAFLLFEGVMLSFHIYLNGNDLGERLSGWYPVSIDITQIVKERRNKLVVVVDSKENKMVPPFGNVVDYLTYGGIYRPVYLEVVEPHHIQNLFVKADRLGNIEIEPVIQGEQDCKIHYKLSLNGKKIQEFEYNKTKISKVEVWDLDNPVLYDLEAQIDKEDPYKVKVGFRSIAWKEDGFYLNGKKVMLFGLNRHQNYPYVGPAMPKAAQAEDADILKYNLGCNVVRTSHYSDSEDFLSRCDEIGLLVINEVPGWQHIGEEKEWRDNFLSFITKMIKKERNHPSLIAYGTRIDESQDDHDLYIRAVQSAHQLDPTRPTLGVRNFKTSECLEDVYGYNDFSCGSLDHGLDDPKTLKGAKGKPILISEHNGHMFPTTQADNPARRLELALRHLRVIDDAYKYEKITGVIGWCAFDYNTHKEFGSGDHICYHGVADLFRNEKDAAFAYKSQNSKEVVFHLASSTCTSMYDEATLPPLYLFTNVEYIKVYRGKDYVGIFYPNKKMFPHLPHPPIIIDDFIGEIFNEPSITKADAKKFVAGLNLIAQKGAAHVSAKDYVSFGPLLIKYHLKVEDVAKLYAKYLSGWGDKANVYTIRGYARGKEVASISSGASSKNVFEIAVSKHHLINEDTYDVARVKIVHKDEYGAQMHRSVEIANLSSEGPIEIIGPHQVVLEGGDISIYVRSLQVKKKTRASLYIALRDEPIKEVQFEVE